jgi:hypothetical protein
VLLLLSILLIGNGFTVLPIYPFILAFNQLHISISIGFRKYYMGTKILRVKSLLMLDEL